MINSLAHITVVLAGCYLLALAAVALLRPAYASRFLLGFVASAYLHYFELLLRVAVGLAFVVHASRMMFGEIFTLFGWLLIGTTAVLFCMPWRWHRRFAQWGVPYAVRYLPFVAIGSLAMGVAILVCSVASVWS